MDMNKMHPVLCKACGKKFVTTGQARYCSQRCRKLTRGNPQSYNYKQGVYLAKSGRRELFQSSLEERHMLFLDAKNVRWARATNIKIPYWNPNTRKNALYNPDFLVWKKDGITVQELKPYGLVNDPVVQAKAAAARDWCRSNGYSYEIVCSPGQY